MITPNGIHYTWKQIFDRLGIKAEADHFFLSGRKISFHYGQPESIAENENHYQLIIQPGKPDGMDLICDDPNYSITRLKTDEFLPSASTAYPVQELPVLFWGKAAPKNKLAEIISQRTLIIHADLIQSIFFMLSRYEEVHLEIEDQHGRFPFSASTACRFGLIELPLVDLYVLILKIWLEEWTGAQLEPAGKFEIALSHDVDFLSPYRPAANWLRSFAKDALRMNAAHILEDVRGLSAGYVSDPYFLGVKRLAETSAKHGIISTFNLMAARRARRDEGYSLESKEFREVIKVIRDHGHQVGLHASYLSFDQPTLVVEEKTRLESAIGAPVSVVRQHYLRVKTPQSWAALAEAGFSRDTSYGFSEHEGFRCGTCHPYPVFDLENDRELPLTEEPLIVMDTTLKTYRKLDVEDGISSIRRMAQMCKAVNGKFTLLWHNTSFFRDWEKWGDLYEPVIASLVELEKD